jgi:hypothetical protein
MQNLKAKNQTILFLTMLAILMFPVFGAAKSGKVHPASGNQENFRFNGGYIIYVNHEDKWKETGRLMFNHLFREKKIDLSSFISEEKEIRIRLIQKGGGAAHVDAVFFSSNPPVNVNGYDDAAFALKKLSKRDNDVLDVSDRTITMTFAPEGPVTDLDGKVKNTKLILAARVEREVIKGEPFQYPKINNLLSDEEKRFYVYSVGKGSFVKPLFREFSHTGSGHPHGFTYGYVKNDRENLYV